jgi:hypothetical protein
VPGLDRLLLVPGYVPSERVRFLLCGVAEQLERIPARAVPFRTLLTAARWPGPDGECRLPAQLEDQMENDAFDSLTRSFTASHSDSMTRRGITRLLGGLALGGPLAVLGWAEVEAKCKKKCGPCKRCKKGKCKPKPAGTACTGGTCQGGACVQSSASCVSQDPAVVCSAGCGTKIDNCGRAITCPCPAGQTCLGNGTCAGTCNPSQQSSCPEGCICPGIPSVDGVFRCFPSVVTSCDQIPKACESSAACPQGTHCQPTFCVPNGSLTNRCMPLCTG